MGYSKEGEIATTERRGGELELQPGSLSPFLRALCSSLYLHRGSSLASFSQALLGLFSHFRASSTCVSYLFIISFSPQFFCFSAFFLAHCLTFLKCSPLFHSPPLLRHHTCFPLVCNLISVLSVLLLLWKAQHQIFIFFALKCFGHKFNITPLTWLALSPLPLTFCFPPGDCMLKAVLLSGDNSNCFCQDAAVKHKQCLS